jgi:hypothetical protein
MAKAKHYLFIAPPGHPPQPQGEVDELVLRHWQVQAEIVGWELHTWLEELLGEAVSAYWRTYWKIRDSEKSGPPVAPVVVPVTASYWQSLQSLKKHLAEETTTNVFGQMLCAWISQLANPTSTLYLERLTAKDLTLDELAKRLRKRAEVHASLPADRRERIRQRDEKKYQQLWEAGHYARNSPPEVPPPPQPVARRELQVATLN